MERRSADAGRSLFIIFPTQPLNIVSPRLTKTSSGTFHCLMVLSFPVEKMWRPSGSKETPRTKPECAVIDRTHFCSGKFQSRISPSQEPDATVDKLVGCCNVERSGGREGERRE